MLSNKHANYNTFFNQPVFPNDEFQSQQVEREHERIETAGKRNLACFWFLGLYTDFGYWVIITAAHDLLARGEDQIEYPTMSVSGRQCNRLSAGVILIVNIVPNFVMKTVLPFLPLWVHTRTFIGVVLSITGFAIAASNEMHVYVLSGLGLCSTAVGIWTSTFLMYIPTFKDEKIVKAWCSGYGASGFLASSTYVVLTILEVDLSRILSFMMAIPPMIAIIFWVLLEHPASTNLVENIQSEHRPRRRTLENAHIIFKLICLFTTPYFLVFFCQYLINQGLFELIYFKDNFIDLATRVRWFNFIYLLALLVASSFSTLKVDCLWILVLLQGINLSFLTTEAVYNWLADFAYSFWLVVAIIFWEGLIAGVSYLNTYRRINQEIPESMRQFCMSINTVGASLGMTVAGFTAVPLHNYICNLPLP